MPRDVAAAPATDLVAQIRERAYQIYLARRGGPGDALSDWLQAEREVLGWPAGRSGVRLGVAASERVTRARGEALLRIVDE